MSPSSERTERQRCSVCGTENDPFYVYCRQCLADLEAKTTASSIACGFCAVSPPRIPRRI